MTDYKICTKMFSIITIKLEYTLERLTNCCILMQAKCIMVTVSAYWLGIMACLPCGEQRAKYLDR